MNELKALFFRTSFLWVGAIDFNELNVHEFLILILNPSLVLLVYTSYVLRLCMLSYE